MHARTFVVAIAGAIVVGSALSGLLEISAREGPFDRPIVPSQTAFTVQGSYLATAGQGMRGPGGVCVPDSVGGGCSPARTEVHLRFPELPHLGHGGAYVAFLDGGGEAALSLGALRLEANAHTLQYTEERDSRSRATLVVALQHAVDASAPGELRVYERNVAGQGRTAPFQLDASLAATLVEGHGRVRVAEIGAMSISVTAVGELAGATQHEGWRYQAWLESIGTPPRFVPLDAFAWSEEEPTRAAIDARTENLRIEDQRRFLITLERDVAPAGSSPLGFPALEAILQT